MEKVQEKRLSIAELVIIILLSAILACILFFLISDRVEAAREEAEKEAEVSKQVSLAQQSKIIQAAKNAYTSYIANTGKFAEYVLYQAEEDACFVAIQNGTALGVYDSQAEAIKAMLGDDAYYQLTYGENGIYICTPASS